MNNNLKTVYRLGELFCGAGGLALGAVLASQRKCSFEHTWVNDIDADSCRTFEKNLKIPSEHIHCCPVESLEMKNLPEVDGMAFGFPCNDFSIVGERRGLNGEFGSLFRYCAKALEVLQPAFFIAENVSGLRSSGGKQDFKVVLSTFEACGYKVTPHLYKFEDYGVPQARHRMIIVGFRSDLNIEFQHPDSMDMPKATCGEALRDIALDAPNHEFARQTSRVVRRLSYIKPGENAFTANLPKELRLNMKSGALISQIYRKLDPNSPSYTVTGSGGGGTHMYHWDENRSLTNRERARLQTFPDSFVFCGNKESVRKQIGMAVPPSGSKIIFDQILKTLLNNGIKSQCC